MKKVYIVAYWHYSPTYYGAFVKKESAEKCVEDHIDDIRTRDLWTITELDVIED